MTLYLLVVRNSTTKAKHLLISFEYESRTIVWGKETPMTWSDIQTKIAELEALKYKEDKKLGYPCNCATN